MLCQAYSLSSESTLGQPTIFLAKSGLNSCFPMHQPHIIFLNLLYASQDCQPVPLRLPIKTTPSTSVAEGNLNPS